MPIIKYKNKGETTENFKTLITNGNPIPQEITEGNIIIADNNGNVKDSGISAAELKQSVTDGKDAIATAISNKGILTASDASFDVMAGNINKIVLSEDGGTLTYTWKKYTANPVSVSEKVTNPSITIGNGATASVTSSNLDLDRVDAEFFNGFTDGSDVELRYSGGSLSIYFVMTGIAEPAIWNSSNHTITFDYDYQLNNMVLTYTGDKYYPPTDPGTYIEDVTSEDSAAYPNGGLHTDGYWYELDSVSGGSATGYYVWARYSLVDGAKGELVDYVTANQYDKYPESGSDGEYWYEKTEHKTAEDFPIVHIASGTYTPTSSTGSVTINVPIEYDMSKIAIAVSRDYYLATYSITFDEVNHTITIKNTNTSNSTYYTRVFGYNVYYIPNCKEVLHYLTAVNNANIYTNITIANAESGSMLFLPANPENTCFSLRRNGTTVSLLMEYDSSGCYIAFSEVVF